MADDIFHPEFKAKPYWWEAAEPSADGSMEVPREADVAVIGSGYAGLNAALELARSGRSVVVLESDNFGQGASTRNGGAVSGGVNLGKGLGGSKSKADQEVWQRVVKDMLGDAADSLGHVEGIIERENIDCFYERRGRFIGAWTPKHYNVLAAKVDALNEHAKAEAYILPRERMREEMASDYYYGGMVVGYSGKLHPALYHKGLLEACRRAGVTLCAEAKVEKIGQNGAGKLLETPRGTVKAGEVVVATNGYTGALTPRLRRRIIPVASHIIATEPLPPDLAASLIPKGRTLSDTRRVLTYYRMSPDNTRMVFGGRARFTQVSPEVSAPLLYEMMCARFPQLRGTKVTHAWTGNVAFTFDYLPHMGIDDGLHYCMGCQGSGIAMMSYLGLQTARKIIGGANRVCAFDRPEFPTNPLYFGSPWFLPIVGAIYRAQDRLDRMRA